MSWRARAAASAPGSGGDTGAKPIRPDGLIVRAWPATTSTTRSHTAAIRWLRLPSSSANRRPDAVAGTTVNPTSGLTSTSVD